MLNKEADRFTESMDFMLSPRATSPYNCGVITFHDELHLNITNSSECFVLENAFINCLNRINIVPIVRKNDEILIS